MQAESATKPPRQPGQWVHLNAPKLLKEWRTGRMFNQLSAAAHIGIDPAKYCSFETGRRRPCLDHAALIERATDGAVTAMDWAQTTRRIRKAKSLRRRS